MFWDDLVRKWRKDTKANSPRLLRAAGGHVAVLPNPQPAPHARPLVIILAVLAILLALLLGSGIVGQETNDPAPTQPTSAAISA